MRPPRALTRAERAALARAAPPPPLSRFPGSAEAASSSAVPEGWDGIMQPGERILWRGQPIRRIRWRRLGLVAGLGLLVMGLALVWMIPTAPAGGFAWMFGLLPFCAGLGSVVVALFDERMRFRDTVFTLSDRAAYIVRRHWWQGRVLETWPLGPDMPLSLRGGDKAGDVIFACRTLPSRDGARTEPVGFFDIIGAPEVFALLKHARDAR